MRKTINKKLRI